MYSLRNVESGNQITPGFLGLESPVSKMVMKERRNVLNAALGRVVWVITKSRNHPKYGVRGCQSVHPKRKGAIKK